ncbi:MAG: hypothetical protein P8L39_07970 [Halioglobus sp.]|nr:hypothetical protein [Halioglobus sp.]
MKISKSNAFYLPFFAIMICLSTSCSNSGSDSTISASTEAGEEAPIEGGASIPLTACTISQSQVLSPMLQTEVPNGTQADLCDFNVMAWESFLYLVQPVSGGGNERRFEITEDYPNYLGEQSDSCAPQSNQEVLNLLVNATTGPGGPEAGTNIEVYSVGSEGTSEGNIVLYHVRFSRNLCGNIGADATLPDNLVEIKTAWRYITPDTSAADYYTIDVTLDNSDKMKLGLIGFHLAQTTPLHPEMIWTTWEHVANVPDCVPSDVSPKEPGNGWTMMTSSCAECIGSDTTLDCTAQCTNSESIYINEGRIDSTGSPPYVADSTNVCRVFPEGTQDGDNQSQQNRANIRALNDQIIGEGGYLAQLGNSDPQSVWRNYQMVGGLWFNNEGTLAPDQQRGSIRLANSVMETTFQGTFTPGVGGTTSSDGGLNCFICHNSSDGYPALQSIPQLSHIAPYVNGPQN